jgi:hypothetical protein
MGRRTEDVEAIKRNARVRYLKTIDETLRQADEFLQRAPPGVEGRHEQARARLTPEPL